MRVQVHLRVVRDPETLVQETLGLLDQILTQVSEGAGDIPLAFSGGRTPLPLYRTLVASGRLQQPIWRRVRWFPGDERGVPLTDPRSNTGTLLRILEGTPAWERVMAPPGWPPGNREAAQRAARQYRVCLQQHLPVGYGGVPRFHVVLLGMGTDGHIASLFPGDPALRSRAWVVPVQRPGESFFRVSLGFRVIRQASWILVLVQGEEKAPALARAFLKKGPLHPCPARGLWWAQGVVHWIVDEAAARDLT